MNHSIQERASSVLQRMNMAFYVVVFVLLKVVWYFVSIGVYFRLTNESFTSGTALEIGGPEFTFLAVTIVAPLFETYVAQHLFFKYLLGRINVWKIVVLSAVFFALFHWYNVGYVFYAFGSGLILATSYALRLRSHPFVCTFLVHSLYNLFGFIYDRWH